MPWKEFISYLKTFEDHFAPDDKVELWGDVNGGGNISIDCVSGDYFIFAEHDPGASLVFKV